MEQPKMIDLNNLEPGQSTVYYTGSSIAITNPESKYTAWEMYMRDEAVLTQKRISGGIDSVSPSIFEYIITRRTGQPRPAEIAKRTDYLKRLNA